MSTPQPIVNTSLRKHPRIGALFKTAESRHLNKEELDEYCKIFPEHSARATAAREVEKVQRSVVEATVIEVLSIYPFEKRFDNPQERCIRDVGYVSVYATHAMLLDDAQWFEQKFLVWLKTIVQAFNYPIRNDDDRKPLFASSRLTNPFPHITQRADRLPEHVRAIYDTYTRLRQHYAQALSPESWVLMEAPLQQVIDVLTSD